MAYVLHADGVRQAGGRNHDIEPCGTIYDLFDKQAPSDPIDTRGCGRMERGLGDGRETLRGLGGVQTPENGTPRVTDRW